MGMRPPLHLPLVAGLAQGPGSLPQRCSANQVATLGSGCSTAQPAARAGSHSHRCPTPGGVVSATVHDHQRDGALMIFAHVAGWAVIVLGSVSGILAMAQLTIWRRRASMKKPGARSEAWSRLCLGVALCLLAAGNAADHLRHPWPLLVPGVALGGLYLVLKIREVRSRPAGTAPSCCGLAQDAEAVALASWINKKRFSTTRLRPGYDEEEVDALLDAVRDTFLGAGNPPLAATEVRSSRFTATRLRPGYVKEEVNNFLDEIQLKLATWPRPATQMSDSGDL
jgi:DivIVA domain-containing protein